MVDYWIASIISNQYPNISQDCSDLWVEHAVTAPICQSVYCSTGYSQRPSRYPHLATCGTWTALYWTKLYWTKQALPKKTTRWYPSVFLLAVNPSQIIYTIYLHNSTYISTIDPVAVKISLSNLWGTALYFHCTCYANIPSGSSSLLWSHWHGCQNWKKSVSRGKTQGTRPRVLTNKNGKHHGK